MRDPYRIPRFCNRLEKIWLENCPDWRFGQFIYNVILSYIEDPFFIEDSKLMEHIEKYFQSYGSDNEVK